MFVIKVTGKKDSHLKGDCLKRCSFQQRLAMVSFV